MNFKSLAISAALAVSTFTGVVANAAPTKCAMRTPSNLVEFGCDQHSRINANGHKVQDITFFDGGKKYQFTIVLWLTSDGKDFDYAEVWHNGSRVTTNAYLAKNGSVCIDNNDHQLCFFPA